MEAVKKICKECPFAKKSIAGWLGEYSSPLELHGLMVSERPFPCHLTHTEQNITFDEAGMAEHPLCAGALAYMRKNGKRPRHPQLCKLVMESGFVDDVMSIPEFLNHHAKKGT